MDNLPSLVPPLRISSVGEKWYVIRVRSILTLSQTVVIHCTKGRVEVCEIETNPVAEVLEMCVQQILVGKNYSQEIIKDISEQAPTAVDDTQWSEFWNWLLQFV